MRQITIDKKTLKTAHIITTPGMDAGLSLESRDAQTAGTHRPIHTHK